MIHYSYNELEKDMAALLPQCRAFDPEMIVAVARGGMIGAQLLAYALDVRNVQLLRAESYDDELQRDEVTVRSEIEIGGCRRVLIVDDIVDSGKTLAAVREYLLRQNPGLDVRCAAPWYKRSAVLQPDFTCREATEWIRFFWDDFKEA